MEKNERKRLNKIMKKIDYKQTIVNIICSILWTINEILYFIFFPLIGNALYFLLESNRSLAISIAILPTIILILAWIMYLCENGRSLWRDTTSSLLDYWIVYKYEKF